MQFGFDEVGRGCIAGPVTTCAVRLPCDLPIYTYKFLNKTDTNINELKKFDNILYWWQEVFDSKKVVLKKRSSLYEELNEEQQNGRIKYMILNCSASLIDEFGISLCIASMLAISVYIFKNANNFYCDGGINIKPNLNLKLIEKIIYENNLKNIDAKSILSIFTKISINFENKSDEKYLAVATASILAKVSRDNFMKNLALSYPEYGWEKNVGYGTKKHLESLQKNGLHLQHRKTWIK